MCVCVCVSGARPYFDNNKSAKGQIHVIQIRGEHCYSCIKIIKSPFFLGKMIKKIMALKVSKCLIKIRVNICVLKNLHIFFHPEMNYLL